jgi:hypothetical protein
MGIIAFKIMGGFVLYFAAGLLLMNILWMGHLFPRLTNEVTPSMLLILCLSSWRLL